MVLGVLFVRWFVVCFGLVGLLLFECDLLDLDVMFALGVLDFGFGGCWVSWGCFDDGVWFAVGGCVGMFVLWLCLFRLV